MGDEDEGRAFFAVEGEEEVEDDGAGGGVEVSGGLVGEEDRGAEGEGAGQGHALLLAAGELDGVVVEAAPEADAVEELAGAGATAEIAAGEFHGKEDVLFGGEGREELVGLEDEADFAAAEEGHLVLGEVGDVFAVEDDLAGGGGVEAGEESEEGAFAATGRAHDGGKLAFRDVEVDALEDVDAVGSGVDGFGEGADVDQLLLCH